MRHCFLCTHKHPLTESCEYARQMRRVDAFVKFLILLAALVGSYAFYQVWSNS